MFPQPGRKLRVAAHALCQNRPVIGDAGDLLFVGRFVFQTQDRLARLRGQHGRNTVGYPFEVPFPGRPFGQVDHVDLPQAAVLRGILHVPLEAVVFGVEQIGVFDLPDPRVSGDARQGGEAVADVQRGRGVDMQVDVEVLHQQSRAERAHQMGRGADRAPDGLDLQRFENRERLPPVAVGQFEKGGVHGGMGRACRLPGQNSSPDSLPFGAAGAASRGA